MKSQSKVSINSISQLQNKIEKSSSLYIFFYIAFIEKQKYYLQLLCKDDFCDNNSSYQTVKR